MATKNLTRVCGIGFLIASIAFCQSQTRAEDTADYPIASALARLTAEVNALRLELLQVQIESAQARLTSSEHQLREAREERRRLDEEEQGLNQQVHEFDVQLLEPTLSPETREDIEQAKVEAQTSGRQTLQAERAAAAEREAIARTRYDSAHKAHSELLARAVKVGVVKPNR
jgi:chromosome segregation ATPase